MKNIVLLITDTFRYDNLGERARRPIRTPMLDKFETERATAVDKFYMSSFPTVPHRTDIMTGTVGWPHYPWQPIDLSGRNITAELRSVVPLYRCGIAQPLGTLRRRGRTH